MATLDSQVRPLASVAARKAASVTARAFHQDPTLQWCFLAEEAGYEDRLAGYLEVGHAWHLGQGHPGWGAWEGGEFVGALYLHAPGIDSGEDAVRELEASLVERCSEEGAARFARYNQIVDDHCPDGRYHVLSIVGVDPNCQRKGIGSRLIERAWREVLRDTESSGLLLDSGSERAVRLYSRLGFETIRQFDLGGSLQSVLFRSRDLPWGDAPTPRTDPTPRVDHR